jgi:hypothetical protein
MYPESVQEQLHKLDKTADAGEPKHKVHTIDHDPNLKEFSGTRAFPD